MPLRRKNRQKNAPSSSLKTGGRCSNDNGDEVPSSSFVIITMPVPSLKLGSGDNGGVCP